jgi:large subunit ribosomal protein L6
MSRIGKKPVPIGKAKVTLKDRHVLVEGPKGKLEMDVHPLISVAMDNDKKEIVVTRPDDEKQSKALHGLTRALLANMVRGVTDGFKVDLELQGVGYRATKQGTALALQVGYSHPVEVAPPEGIAFEVPQPNRISVAGIDKELVGQVAARIRAIREPDAYKGKGIRYAGERVRLKPGKAGRTVGGKA